MSRLRVLLADDHRIVAEGIRGLLEPEFELVGIVEDGRALLEAAETLHPDVIVADISMPLLNGIDAVRQIKAAHKEIKVVFLTMHPDLTYAASAMQAGASGYVLKHSAPAELITAIRSALNGRIYVTPSVADGLSRLKKDKPGGRPEVRRLTTRQCEVMQLLTEGHSAKEIASILGISSRTVEFHKYKLMDDLGLSSTADLVQYALKHGIAGSKGHRDGVMPAPNT